MYMKEIKSILLREGKHPKARTAFGVHRPLRRMSALPSAQSPRRVNRCAVRGSSVALHVATVARRWPDGWLVCCWVGLLFLWVDLIQPVFSSSSPSSSGCLMLSSSLTLPDERCAECRS